MPDPEGELEDAPARCSPGSGWSRLVSSCEAWARAFTGYSGTPVCYCAQIVTQTELLKHCTKYIEDSKGHLDSTINTINTTWWPPRFMRYCRCPHHTHSPLWWSLISICIDLGTEAEGDALSSWKLLRLDIFARRSRNFKGFLRRPIIPEVPHCFLPGHLEN